MQSDNRKVLVSSHFENKIIPKNTSWDENWFLKTYGSSKINTAVCLYQILHLSFSAAFKHFSQSMKYNLRKKIRMCHRQALICKIHLSVWGQNYGNLTLEFGGFASGLGSQVVMTTECYLKPKLFLPISFRGWPIEWWCRFHELK